MIYGNYGKIFTKKILENQYKKLLKILLIMQFIQIMKRIFLKEIFEFEYTSPESVFDAWKTIWENKNLNRAYTYDIEEYYEEGKFRIYISIK